MGLHRARERRPPELHQTLSDFMSLWKCEPAKSPAGPGRAPYSGPRREHVAVPAARIAAFILHSRSALSLRFDLRARRPSLHTSLGRVPAHRRVGGGSRQAPARSVLRRGLRAFWRSAPDQHPAIFRAVADSQIDSVVLPRLSRTSRWLRAGHQWNGTAALPSKGRAVAAVGARQVRLERTRRVSARALSSVSRS